MKGCFLLQRRFARVGNELASLLKERHGINEFCGYVHSRKSYEFLQQQKEVNYSALLLDEEIHEEYRAEKLDWEYLHMLEREYGLPTLWSYIENDRVVRYRQLLREYPYNAPRYSYEDMLRILQVKAKRILQFLEDEKPDFIVFSVIASMASLLLYTIAKKKRIKTFVLLASRVGSMQLVSDTYGVYTKFPSQQQRMPANIDKARAFLKDFRDNPRPYAKFESLDVKRPDRSRHFKFLLPRNLFTSIGWQMRMWTGYFSSSDRNDFDTIKPWHAVWDALKRKFRILRGYEDLYDLPVENEPYAFFPLQLEPEMTTALYAPYFGDQAWVAKLIAKSLPVGYQLYIKEHPAMFGYRPRAFYKELKKIPNVRLIHPNVRSYPLIERTQLVVTITSTVGWEALMFKKPVITFGDALFNVLPMIKQCRTPEELPHLVKKQLDNFVHDEDALVNFIAGIYQEGVDVDISDIWEKEAAGRVEERRNELVPLANLIRRKVDGR